jgi:alanyl-tRNA synthetase
VCDVLGGKSGGKEPLLQGRGTNPEKLDDAVAAATRWIKEKLKL